MVCFPYSMMKLDTALSHMKAGAAGPDGVSPQMLKELSATGNPPQSPEQEPSLRPGAHCMAQSKHHTNSQKQETPERPSSYRPISLTSCICKLAGRLLQSRLAYLLEVNNILAPEQAGLRSGRCTEEQIARL